MTRLFNMKLTTAVFAASTAASTIVGGAAWAQNFVTDVIIQGSACVGIDCSNGESFGFDTLRLKENNLRIKFQDTSASASFPSNDWTITANDSSNGGANYLRFDDVTSGRSPFTVEAGANANTLYVEADGDVGIKTSDPVVDLHIIEGNTPTVRLEQDGSDGFAAQTYDIAANESNFFIRDVTNGSRLFFRSKPGAPEDSLFIAADGDVGLGTDSPDDALDIQNTTASVAMRLTNSTGAWRLNHNNNTGRLNIERAGATTPLKLSSTADENLLLVGTNVNNQVDITGNLAVSGTISVAGTQVHPDYVFAPDYDLMPLYEVERFVIENHHLPRIPSAADVQANGLNMTKMQLSLLEKVEELTLYTIEQQKMIDRLREELATQ